MRKINPKEAIVEAMVEAGLAHAAAISSVAGSSARRLRLRGLRLKAYAPLMNSSTRGR